MAANGFSPKNVNVENASTCGFRMAGCALDGGNLHIAAMVAVTLQGLAEASAEKPPKRSARQKAVGELGGWRKSKIMISVLVAPSY